MYISTTYTFIFYLVYIIHTLSSRIVFRVVDSRQPGTVDRMYGVCTGKLYIFTIRQGLRCSRMKDSFEAAKMPSDLAPPVGVIHCFCVYLHVRLDLLLQARPQRSESLVEEVLFRVVHGIWQRALETRRSCRTWHSWARWSLVINSRRSSASENIDRDRGRRGDNPSQAWLPSASDCNTQHPVYPPTSTTAASPYTSGNHH